MSSILTVRKAAIVAANILAVSLQLAMGAQPSKSADDEWQELKDAGRRKSVVAPKDHDAAVIEKSRQNFVRELLGDADKLKDFQAKYPTHPQSKEAKRLEALALIQAWQAGDSSRDSRRQQVVSEFRKDSSVQIARRAEVAAFADNVAVGKRHELTHDDRVAAYEKTVRNLIREFPEMPDGYASLLEVAKDSPDAKTLLIARDVLAMESAPQSVKKSAQHLIERHALIGKSLQELSKPVLAPGNVTEKAQGKAVIIYSWATFSAGSIAQAKDIASKLSANVVAIGVNLDRRDLTAAKALAVTEKLPGDQIYDWFGHEGDFAQQLKLTDVGLVYIADKNGTLRSVSAKRNLANALASLEVR